MTDIRNLTDAEIHDLMKKSEGELREVMNECRAELHRRNMVCPNCGGITKAWHVHVCDEAGGANLPLESEAAKAICRTAA
jgi:hypothetical protein